MWLSNLEMDQKIATLQGFLDRRDKIGYAAARNTRLLSSACSEYLNLKEELIFEFGSPELDQDGNETGRRFIKMPSPEYEKFCEAIEAYSNICHEVEVFKICFADVEEVLSGTEILAIDWMLED